MSAAISETHLIDKTLDGWNLPVAAYNILKREGYDDIDKLVTLTESDLLDMRGFLSRPIAREHLIRIMHKQGYNLAGYIDVKEVTSIPGIAPGYLVNRAGTQVTSPLNRRLKPILISGKSYISVKIDGRYTKIPVAVMMLSAFIAYQSNSQPVHLDGNPSNCAIDNLDWGEIPTTGKRSGRKRKISDPLLNTLVDVNTPTKRKTPAGGMVDTYRMYVSDDVTAMISDDGSGSVTVGGTTLCLTRNQLTSLIKVSARIGEVNSLMGIG